MSSIQYGPASIKKHQRQDDTTTKHLGDEVKTIESVAEDHNICGQVREVGRGPSITTYALDVKSGISVARVKQLEIWLASAISVPFVHITKCASQRNRFFLEVPNKGKQLARFAQLAGSTAFQKAGEGPMIFGVDVEGEPLIIRLEELPHLLVAGNSGQENLRLINSLITSLIMRSDPRSLQILLIDPKQTAFYIYKNCPYLFVPVVPDVGKAVIWLQWLDAEVDARLQQQNAIAAQKKRAVKKEKHASFKPPTLLVVINELADLVVEAKQVVDKTIKRIVKHGGKVGLHLIVGTQCPSETVVPEVLRSRLISQCVFHTATRAESVTLLGRDGSEKLMGVGDGLMRLAGKKQVMRVYVPTIRNKDIWKRWKRGNPHIGRISEKLFQKRDTQELRNSGIIGEKNNKPP
jgi:DNA segregation ATPase FtsK/SpoIIIE, S-DNA-T family